MNKDMTVPCEDGLINLRVGAIIMKDGKLLMIGNNRAPYLYSVGGRIKLGETSEEAVEREVFEETGIKAQVERLVVVCENFFKGIGGTIDGLDCHTMELYYIMKIQEDNVNTGEGMTDDGEPLV